MSTNNSDEMAAQLDKPLKYQSVNTWKISHAYN